MKKLLFLLSATAICTVVFAQNIIKQAPKGLYMLWQLIFKPVDVSTFSKYVYAE